MRQEKADKLYMRICDIIAEQSYSNRSKVGAVLVKDDNILSFGYNGTPAGFDNCCENIDTDYPCSVDRQVNELFDCGGFEANSKETCLRCKYAKLSTKPEVLHAESNALMKLVKTGKISSAGATLYVTYSPCIDCAKMLVQASIKRVVYRHEYRCLDGLELLKSAGIQVEQYKDK